MVLSRLGILPDQYYDLTLTETRALLDGVTDREADAWRRCRVVATLLRNAHFKDPIAAEEYMPLPGDKQRPAADPMVDFVRLAGILGVDIIKE